jgi:probable F420-dependent oxidoreductase
MEYAALMPMMEDHATPENLVGFAKKAEALGFHALFASDHVVIPYEIKPVYKGSADGQFPFPKEGRIIEPLIAMSVAGMATERIKVATAVLVLPHRNPVLVAKQLASIDFLTGGRVMLGAGAGWMEEEITMLGQPFAERGAWCTEAIDLMRAMWADEPASFKGKYFDIPDVGFQPKPVNKHIPILIGGTSGPALRRAVKQGDGWLPSNLTFDLLEAGIATLKENCERGGRDYGELMICLRARMAFEAMDSKYKVMFVGSDDQILENLGRLKEMGVGMVLFEPIYKEYSQWVEAHEHLAENILPKV